MATNAGSSATMMADMNSSTTSTSGSMLLERLKRKKLAALRKTVPIARDEEPLFCTPIMDPVLDSPSEEGTEEQNLAVRQISKLLSRFTKITL